MRKGFAFILIGFGVLSLLTNFYSFSIQDIWPFLWPSVLIVVGLSSLIRNRQLQIFSLVLVLIGGLYFLRALRILVISDDDMWSYIWPSILILLGLHVLLTKTGNFERKPKKESQTFNASDPSESVSEAPTSQKRSSNQNTYNVFLGAIDERIDTQQFRSCTVNAFMGAADVDFTHINWEGEAHIELNAIMGAIECRVPEGVRIQVSGTPIAAGFENTCISNELSDKVLRISYTAVLGGIEINQK